MLVIAVDLDHSFYLFLYEWLAELFAFEHAYRASELITYIDLPDGTRDHLLREDYVFPWLSSLPMRWSWSLPFRHCVCAKALVLAAGRMRLSVRAAQQHSLLERREAPRVGPGMPVLAPYVDSCNAMV